jgi:hypothetical protein
MTPEFDAICQCSHEHWEHDTDSGHCTVIEAARRRDDEYCRCRQFSEASLQTVE